MKLHSFRQDLQDYQDFLGFVSLYPVHPVDPVRKWKVGSASVPTSTGGHGGPPYAPVFICHLSSVI